MTRASLVEVEHEVTIAAPAATVYKLIANVENWPHIFPPTIHAEQMECPDSGQDSYTERIQIWATAGGEAKNWTSRRWLDPKGLRIGFRQEISAPPVAAMGGTWVIEPVSVPGCRVRLLHEYRAIDDDPQGLAWIGDAVDRNSRSELAALKSSAESAGDAAGLRLSFEDTVQINGSGKDVYDFLNDADRWPERLPHVARVNLEEKTPGLQVLEMDTRAKDGSAHTTRSVRVCFPYSRIVYKQLALPALMTLHTGCWRLEENGDGIAATAQHTVMINTASIAKILGEDADVPQARAYIQDALSTNSLTTLRQAKKYAEDRR